MTATHRSSGRTVRPLLRKPNVLGAGLAQIGVRKWQKIAIGLVIVFGTVLIQSCAHYELVSGDKLSDDVYSNGQTTRCKYGIHRVFIRPPWYHSLVSIVTLGVGGDVYLEWTCAKPPSSIDGDRI